MEFPTPVGVFMVLYGFGKFLRKTSNCTFPYEVVGLVVVAVKNKRSQVKKQISYVKRNIPAKL